MSKKPTLTENQKKFATLLVYEAGRKSPAECAFESGYKTRPRQAASELKNPKIYPLVAAFINELREEDIIKITEYPKKVGQHKQKDVMLHIGPYGTYMKYDNKNYRKKLYYPMIKTYIVKYILHSLYTYLHLVFLIKKF